MKMSVEWHKQCLKNQKRTLEIRRLNIDDSIRKLLADEKNTSFYEMQITGAEGQGKDSFDRDKFMVKRVNK